MNRRAFIKRTSSIGVIVMLTLLTASCNSKADREKQEQSQRKARQTKVKNDLAVKFGAITDWDKNLKDRGLLYTIDVQEALIRSDKTPVLFEAFVEDVTRDNNKYIVRLVSSSLEIYFLLECTPEVATKFRSRKGFKKVAVIALISFVTKPTIKLESELASPDESPDIEVTTPDTFIAKGSVLDFDFLE